MNKFVFISGLHRSGTSILHRVLSTSSDISGFNNTGVPEDEGQHLQSVFKAAKYFGGPGKFAFNGDARLNENSSLISSQNKNKLLNEWGNFWDKEKPIWIEKSPPNIIRTRFFQSLFPEAYFITIIRHPVAVSLATQKWSKTSYDSLINHWITAHKIYQQDRTKLRNEFFFSYEYMVNYPRELIKNLSNFLDTEIPYNEQFKNSNEKYFMQWNNISLWKWNKMYHRNKSIRKYESYVNDFGYSLINLADYPMTTYNNG